MATGDDVSSTGLDTSEDEVVESLVAGRQKRSTAGKNMSSLLDAAADDDLTLLFAEDEDDNEFDEDEAADGEFDDMGLDSSSDDEDDQGPNAADDDLEGEKELEKQARVDRKKRKAQESLRLQALRKKIKIDPHTAANVPAATPRPKKKSERVSWLPTPEEGPVRSSSRRQTMKNKELTHARLKDSEQRRIKLIATMEEAAKRKEKRKPKVRTQEERLAEAEKIERLNSKSLNRWEEMEKRKAEERKAKLEALQNRRLEGPVMSWWSGIAKWVNGKLVRVGNVPVKPKPEKEESERKKKTKDAAAQEAPKETKTSDQPEAPAAETNGAPPPAEAAPAQEATVPTIASAENAAKQVDAVPQTQREASAGPLGFLDGIHQYAALPTTAAPETTETEVKAPEPSNPQPESADASGKQQADEPVDKAEATTQDDTPIGDGKTEDTQVVDTPAEKPTADSSEDASGEKPRSETTPAEGVPDTEMQDAPDVFPEGATETAETEKQTETHAETHIDTHTDIQAAGQNTDQSGVDDTANVEKTNSTQPKTTDAEQQQPAEQTESPVPEAAPVLAETSETNTTKPVPAAEPTLGEIEATARPEDIERTGRNVLVLENFDNATMQSREYSIYFNSKKPPRLTSAFFSPFPLYEYNKRILYILFRYKVKEAS